VVYPDDEPPGWIVGPHQGTWLTITDYGIQGWILAGPLGKGIHALGSSQ
jgi:hypothetical protein